MKRRKNIYLLSTLTTSLCLLALLFSLSACGDAGQAEESASTTTSEVTTAEVSETAPPVEVFRLSTEVRVMRPTGDISDDLLTAVKLFTSAGKALLGDTMTISEDWYRGELVRGEFEILLGNTNRPESGEAYEALTYYDYMYEVISPHIVVICGGSDGATVKAVQKFLADCYGYTLGKEGGEVKDIPVGTSYTYKHDYSLDSLSLCGKAIDSYTIVHGDKSTDLTAAKLLRQEIEKVCGIKLALATTTDFKSGNAILLGCADTDGSHLERAYGSYSYIVRYEPGTDGDRLILDSTVGVGKVAQAFADQFLAQVPSEGDYDLVFSQEERVCCVATDEMNGLVLAEVTQETIADGVLYSKRTYKDADGKPVLAYVIEADLTKVEVLNATPNYGDAITNVKATTLQAMKSVRAAGYEVYAGVNADFFRINSDYSPQGLCVKGGKVLSGVNNRPWFGITEDGKPVIGTAAAYGSTYSGKLAEAVGGSNILLTDGYCSDIAYNTEFGYTRHPRTAVGFTEDGSKLFLVVVDGRQPKISNGASLGDLAAIFLELGATDAINLDGGGSSTIITSAAADRYTTRNSPSDGSLRSVYNSVVIVGKK